jgi:hypothetical protein
MSTISDTRKTVLEIINEVRRKLGIKDATSLSQDKNSTTLLDYLNDVVSYIADFGNWQETMQEVTVTASTSVFQYLVNTSAPLQHIQEIAFYGQVAKLRYVEIEDMRRWRRIGGTGIPRNWTIFGVDNTTTGNPYIQVYPQPGTNENNQTFSILCFTKPPKYTTSDGSTTPPFPARMLVSMLLALALLDESRGTQNVDYYTELQRFNDTIEQTLNRYTSDSGGDTNFVPRRGGFNKL